MSSPSSKFHLALDLLTQPSQPSLGAIQISDDGQIAVLTRTSIYIVTPALGLTFDIASTIPAVPQSLRYANEHVLRIFQTIAELDPSGDFTWANKTTDHPSLALGSLAVICRAMTWSPSNLSMSGTCLLAVLTSNLQVFLYEPSKNYLKGHWSRSIDMTEALLESAPPSSDGQDASGVQRVLFAQTNCLAWSSQPTIEGIPSSADVSLLALGSRAGCVSLWSYDGVSTMSHEMSVKLSEAWTTHVAWSTWTSVNGGEVSAMIACAMADGSIKLVSVTRKLRNKLGLGLNAKINDAWSCPPHTQSITGIRWIHAKGTGSVLVYSKPGTIHLWSPARSGLDWSGHRELYLEKQAAAVGSSALVLSSGLDYDDENDAILMGLSDGSFTVIHDVSNNPSLHSQNATLTSLSLTKAARSSFAAVEGRDARRTAMMRTNATNYIGLGAMLWMYRKTYPSAMLYEPEQTQESSLVMTQLWDMGEMHDHVLIDFFEKIRKPAPATRKSPNVMLLPLFVYVVHHQDDEDLQDRLANILEPPHWETTDGEIRRALAQGSKFARTSQEHKIQDALTLDVIDGCYISRLRSMLNVAIFAMQMGFSLSDEISALRRLITCHIMSGVLYGLADEAKAVNEQDSSFVKRILSIVSRLPSVPKNVQTTAAEVATQLKLTVNQPGKRDSVTSGEISPTALAESVDISERCPVCQIPIMLTDLAVAQCDNGHMWDRCSITSLILATPYVRTCVGCSRKALPRPPRSVTSEHDNQRQTHGWFADQLLQVASCCLYCGNRLVTVL